MNIDPKEWKQLEETKATARQWREYEQNYRSYMVTKYFSQVGVGKTTVALEEGASIVCEKALNYKVLEQNLNAVFDLMIGAQDRADGTPYTAEQMEHSARLHKLVKWKPELNLTEYKKLTPEERAIFDNALVKSPATPTLEVVRK